MATDEKSLTYTNPANRVDSIVKLFQNVAKHNDKQSGAQRNLPLTVENFRDKDLLGVLDKFNDDLFKNHESGDRSLRSVPIQYKDKKQDSLFKDLIDAHNKIRDELEKTGEIDQTLKAEFLKIKANIVKEKKIDLSPPAPGVSADVKVTEDHFDASKGKPGLTS